MFTNKVKPKTNDDGHLGIWQQINEDSDCVFERDPAARSRLEILMTYPGVHALLWQRLSIC